MLNPLCFHYALFCGGRQVGPLNFLPAWLKIYAGISKIKKLAGIFTNQPSVGVEKFPDELGQWDFRR